jgi:apolipoprotein N-acyltransferase
MDFARNWWGRTLLLSGAAAATAGLFYLGTGLHPMPWLTWLAPLPALLIAPRVSLPAAIAVAFIGYLVGLAGYGRYLLADLDIPGPAVIGILTGVSMIFTVVVLLFRGLLRRGWALIATVVAPAAWTSAEFLVARLGPYGANWSLANAQAEAKPG